MPPRPVVVVIEHQPELGQVIRDVLGQEGYDVTTVRDRYGAIGFLRKEKVHMLVADLPKPGSGEGDPLADFATEFPSLPIVVVHDEGEGAGPFFGPWHREGNRVTLRRPFRLDDLVDAVRELVE